MRERVLERGEAGREKECEGDKERGKGRKWAEGEGWRELVENNSTGLLTQINDTQSF